MKISKTQRRWALLLAIVIVLSAFPTFTLPSNAAGTLTVTDANVGLSWTDPDSDNGSANWTASGTTVTGTAKGYKSGFMNMQSNSVTTTLTITNNHSDDRTLSFDYTLVSGGSVSGLISGTSGSYSDTLAAGSSATITLTSPKGTGTNTLTISSLVLLSASNVTSTFLAPENGSYIVDGVSVTAQKQLTKPSTEAYALSATPAANYMFFGWWSEASQSYVSYDATASLKFSSDPQLKPVFLHNTTALFGVGTKTFADLTEAVNFANSSAATTKTVVLLNNGTISGNHTIPSGVTLLIPRDTAYTAHGAKPECTNSAAATPYAFLTLTLGSGTTITVNGTGSIEVEGMHTTLQGAGSYRPYGGRVSGPYGAIYMSPDSNITLNNGATLYAWGYVYGNGSVTANSGSKVYESFQMTDFPGGSNLSAFVDTATDTDADGDGIKNNDYVKSFPFSQYYIQNIEVPLTIHYGATEYVYATITITNPLDFLGDGKEDIGTPIEFIGSSGLFVPESGCSITKKYDPLTDRLIIDCDGSAQLKNLLVDMSKTGYSSILKMVLKTDKIDSANFILSLNSNMTLNINSGTVTIKQNVSLLPGVKVNIAQGAKLVLDSATNNSNLNANGTGGYNAYIYDKDEWGNFAFTVPAAPLGALSYSPSAGRYTRKASDLVDVVIDINGELICNGFLYTTKGGASIISSKGTGVVKMVNGAGDSTLAYRLDGTSSKDATSEITSAKLQNDDGSYLSTAGAAAGTEYNYCAECDAWYEVGVHIVTWKTPDGEINQEFDAHVRPVYGTTPIKSATAQYTYTFAGWATTENGTVLSTLPHVTGDITYYAVFTSVTRSYTVTWNINGDTTGQELAYGTVPSYIGTPTKAFDATNHYTFAGWATTENGAVLSTLPAVTGDVTYYAVFTAVAHNDDKIEDGKHYCNVCNYLISSCYDEGEDHVCDVGGEQMDCCGEYLTSVSRKDATCDEPGYEAYYRCSCGKLYSDAEAQTVISEPVAIPAKDHAWGEPDSYTNNGNGTHTANYVCGNDASHTKSDDPVEHVYASGTCVCGDIEPVKNVEVRPEFGTANVTYSISGQVVTVTHSIACKVGYWSEADGKYIAIDAEDNGDGSYSFKAPDGVTEVLLVVNGDVTGDGKVTAADTGKLNASLIGRGDLTDTAAFAGDLTGEGKLTAADTGKLNASLIGRGTISW